MSDLIKLYDENGNRVGTYCVETGRAQIGMNFFVIERACHIDTSTYEQGGIVKCDACGKRIPTKHRNTHTVEAKYPHCPWCGAKVVYF